MDALGVDGEQDFNAVSGPLRDLGRWNASVKGRTFGAPGLTAWTWLPRQTRAIGGEESGRGDRP